MPAFLRSRISRYIVRTETPCFSASSAAEIKVLCAIRILIILSNLWIFILATVPNHLFKYFSSWLLTNSVSRGAYPRFNIRSLTFILDKSSTIFWQEGNTLKSLGLPFNPVGFFKSRIFQEWL